MPASSALHVLIVVLRMDVCEWAHASRILYEFNTFQRHVRITLSVLLGRVSWGELCVPSILV